MCLFIYEYIGLSMYVHEFICPYTKIYAEKIVMI